VIAAPAAGRLTAPRPAWLAFLRRELAPSPGRVDATLRMVLTTVLVVVISMTLEVPEMALSAYMVFFIQREDPVTTALLGVTGVLSVAVSIALTIVAYLLTIEYPAARIVVMASLFFGGMFVLRASASVPAGFLLGWIPGFVIMVLLAVVDSFDSPEALVRFALWMWVALAFPIAILIAMNLLLLPADPERILRRELAARLRAVAHALPELAANRRHTELTSFAEAGSPRLFQLLALAGIRHASLKSQSAQREALITLVDRLVTATAAVSLLESGVLPALPRAHLEALADKCARLADAIEGDSAPGGVHMPPPGQAREYSTPQGFALLTEIDRLVEAIPLAMQSATAARVRPEPKAKGKKHLFTTDAFTNPAYPRFALKTTLAVMFCYVAFTAVDWPGIHTCVITCAIVALTSTGATLQKSTLRIAGCLLGGATAIAVTVFVMPHLESLTDLALLIAIVAAPAAWIASGSERISYLGLQMAFAFFLCVLQGYGPGTEITMVRDRIVGILFGNLVMLLVFVYIWPERAGAGAWQKLSGAVRGLARLVTVINPDDVTRNQAEVQKIRLEIYEQLGTARKLTETARFEPDAYTPGGKRELARLDEQLVAAQTAFIAALSLAEADVRSDSPSKDEIELYRTLAASVDALLTARPKPI
jgi:multidrug resistance protein MdtO